MKILSYFLVKLNTKKIKTADNEFNFRASLPNDNKIALVNPRFALARRKLTKPLFKFLKIYHDILVMNFQIMSNYTEILIIVKLKLFHFR